MTHRGLQGLEPVRPTRIEGPRADTAATPEPSRVQDTFGNLTGTRTTRTSRVATYAIHGEARDSSPWCRVQRADLADDKARATTLTCRNRSARPPRPSWATHAPKRDGGRGWVRHRTGERPLAIEPSVCVELCPRWTLAAGYGQVLGCVHGRRRLSGSQPHTEPSRCQHQSGEGAA